MRLVKYAIWWIACACASGSALAEEQWPNLGDVVDRGQELQGDELGNILQFKTAVIVLLLPGPVFGRVFSCTGDQSVLFEFIPPSTSSAATSSVTSCQIAGPNLCFDQGGDWEHCLTVRRLAGSPLLYTGLFEEEPEMRDMPAQVLGILPFEIDRLNRPSGEFDFGPLAITLPAEVPFELREGRGFPLSLIFGTGPKYDGGWEISIAVMGWPDSIGTDPGPRNPAPEDWKLAEDEVADWEKEGRTHDPDSSAGGDPQSGRYEATKITLPAGSCVRVREQAPPLGEGEVSEEAWPESVSFYQYCISPSGGAQLLVTIRLPKATGIENVSDFDESALTILDSLRLGYELPE